MTAFAVSGLILLAIAALITLSRIFRGPTNLDRIVAADVLLTIIIAGIAMEAAWHETTRSLPLLMILGMIVFIGGVAVTRFLSHDSDREESS